MEFRDIKQGSQHISWSKKSPQAYWKGNPDVQSPVRIELLKCNHSRMWGAQIMRQVKLKQMEVNQVMDKVPKIKFMF